MLRDKINALFSAVRAIFADMKSVESDKGTIYYEDDEIKVGTILYTENGVITEGEFIIGGNKVKVENGSVVEIEAEVIEEPKPVEEEASKEELGCGDKTKMEDVKPEEEPVVAEPKVDVEPEVKEEKMADEDMIKNIAAAVIADATAPILAAIDEINNRLVQIDARVKGIEGEPEAKEPSEEFKRVSTDKYDRIAAALRELK